MRAFTYSLQLLAANITTNTESAAGEVDFGSAIVSFLYFLGALLLIYLVLVLVDKWGKRHPEKEEKKSEKQSNKESKNGLDNLDSKDSKDNIDSIDNMDVTDNKNDPGEDNG